MAYQTGTSATCSDLLTSIVAFAAANGFTSPGGGVLHDGTSGWRLTAEYTDQRLRLESSNSIDLSTGTCVNDSNIFITTANWPVTYHLFAGVAPLSLVCIVQYDTDYYQYMSFGNIVKYGSYVGGNYGCASLGRTYAAAAPIYEPTSTWHKGFSDKCIISYTTYVCAPFWGFAVSASGFPTSLPWTNIGTAFRLYQYSQGSHVHVELDGFTWPGQDVTTNDLTNSDKLPCVLWQGRLASASPNDFNGRAVLTPHYLYMHRGSYYQSCIGRLPHIRMIRINNYSPGDIVTLGVDRWMVFPYLKKVVDHSGDLLAAAGTSGVYGWAIRYDGP